MLSRGVYAVIGPTTLQPFIALQSYCKEYRLPLVSTSSPDVSRELSSMFSVFVEPGTAGATLTMLRRYNWKEIIYLYDGKHGPGKLQDIFLMGYGAVNWTLIGLLRVESDIHANQYLRQLEQSMAYRHFHVILDTDAILARDIIVRHVHDAQVGKSNFHFLITTPVSENFWTSEAPKFSVANVTAFSLPYRLNKYTLKHRPLNVSSYLYHDAAYIVANGLRKMVQIMPRFRRRSNTKDCLLGNPDAYSKESELLMAHMKKAAEYNDLSTGKMKFNERGQRENFSFPVMARENFVNRQFGVYHDLYGLNESNGQHGFLSPLRPSRNGRQTFKITSILSPPFLMLKNTSDDKQEYVGYCKDLIDLLAGELDIDYNLTVVSDGLYGVYLKEKGQWAGMIGEIVRGDADMAVADIHMSSHRQRVVDLVDIPLTSSLSVLLKSPSSFRSNPGLFFLVTFSTSVWICILISAIAVIGLIYVMSKYTGMPDSIEAASGIWRKPSNAIGSVWFIIGSSLLQGTGIYPRSISCRILGASWWCFSLILLATFVASITSQLSLRFNVDDDLQAARLMSVSMESVLRESMRNGWPQIGIIRKGRMYHYIKQSSLPFLQEYVAYLDAHPELIMGSKSQGMLKLQESNGDFGLIMESSQADYLIRRMPCDIISIRDVMDNFLYAIAVPLESTLRAPLQTAITRLQMRGDLGHLRRKWFTYKTACTSRTRGEETPKGLEYFSGLFYFLLVGSVTAVIVGLLQHFWKVQKKEEKRQKVSFEEVSLGQNLPLPPPELLRDSPDGDNGPIDGWAERRFIPTSFQRPNIHSNDPSEPT